VAIDTLVIDAGKLQWFYREAKPINETNKSPVIFLHGLLSQSYSWTQVMPALAEQGFRCIAPDWIGSGLSAKPERRNFAYTPDAFIESFAALIQALEIEKFYLVVQGFVGSTGLQYALRYPDQIERLAILNTPLSTDAKLPWKIQQLGLPFVGDMMTQDPLVVDRTLEAGCRYTISDEDLDVYRRPFLKSSDVGRSLLYTVRNLQLKPAMAELETGFKNWQKPTLILWGMQDPWLSSQPAQNLAKTLENGQFVELEQAGHYPQEHWSENVSNTLVPFLRRQQPG
jgi:pimeloyl-ACP methyl ester carboxylesterase